MAGGLNIVMGRIVGILMERIFISMERIVSFCIGIFGRSECPYPTTGFLTFRLVWANAKRVSSQPEWLVLTKPLVGRKQARRAGLLLDFGVFARSVRKKSP